MRAKRPAASGKATQQGLLPVDINALEINSISFYKEMQIFFVLTFKLDPKKSNFKTLKFFANRTVPFLQPTLYGLFLKNTALFKFKLKDYLELSCINTSQVSA